VPVERHAERLRTPLGRSDKRLLIVFALVTVIAVVAGGAYAVSHHGPSNDGCVVVTIPGSIGGVTLRNCGAAAVRFCRKESAGNEAIAAACKRRSYATRPSALSP